MLTNKERAIIEAYTGYCMLAGEKSKAFYEYLQEIMGRPVFTHELANEKILEEIHEKAKPDFLKLCASGEEAEP